MGESWEERSAEGPSTPKSQILCPLSCLMRNSEEKGHLPFVGLEFHRAIS